MALLSMRQYAKHRGCSVEAVSKAVKTGRISTTLDEAGKRKIDPEAADREWALNTEQAKAPKPELFEKEPEQEKQKGPNYAQNRAIREAFAARLTKLDFEERSGKLINADEVRDAAFKAARTVRDAMMNIPDRLAAELAAESNQFRVHQRLSEEIRRALESLQLPQEN